MESSLSLPELARLPTRVPGLDAVLGGGLLVGDAYLVAGSPGTGKTTLGNQLAFAHAAAGGTAVVATLGTETHDRMLAHLRGFRFADPALVGGRLRYVSLLDAWQGGGIDGAIGALMGIIRQHGVGLVVVDGTWDAASGSSATAEAEVGATGSALDPGASGASDLARFVRGLQVRAALHGCTVVLLAGSRQALDEFTHVDGVLELTNTPVGSRGVRRLEVVKLRGSDHLNGLHRFVIEPSGVVVFPRLEAALAGTAPAWQDPGERMAFGVAGLDAMLSGGLPAGASTVVFGTPGSGKTMLGLHFLAEGARRGEPGLISGFQETASALVSTADQAGLEFGDHVASGLVRVLWWPPLELAPDAWAWRLLAEVDEHRPRRLLVDTMSDVLRLLADPGRRASFLTALTNALRDRGVTLLYNQEIDELVSPELRVPVPGLSAAMDAAILLRTVELDSRLGRLLSVLKVRQSAFDPTIREFAIAAAGVEVGEPFRGSSLLTGAARPERRPRAARSPRRA